MKLEKEHVRRCAIFLFFDTEGIVDDYVIKILDGLRPRVEHILTICNGYVNAEGRQKLKDASDDFYCRANLGLDVGGYREGLFYLGFKKLAEFDELIMLNYTFFGPVYPFEEMFDAMKERDVDFWGITKHHRVDPDPFGVIPYGYLPEHIQSFFLVLRPSLFLSYQYKDFIFNMKNPQTYTESIVGYETIFTKYFSDEGFRWDVYVNTEEYEGYSYCPNTFYIKELLEEKRCPIIKRRSFFTDYMDFLLNTCGEPSVKLLDFMREHCEYDENLIWDNILRLENHSEVHQDMHFNYALPVWGSAYIPERGRSVLCILVESVRRIRWYHRYLKQIPDWTDCCVIGKKELCQEAVRYLGASALSHLKIVELETFSYRQALIAASECAAGYQMSGILLLADVEKAPPYSNEVSHQYADWENMLGTEEYLANLSEVFEKNPRLGMLIPPVPDYGTWFAKMEDGWMGRYSQLCALLEQWKVKANHRKASEPLVPAGGSFWIRSRFLIQIGEWLRNTGEDFDTETVLLAMPFAVQSLGAYTGVAYSDRYLPVMITNQDYRMRANNQVVFKKYGPNYLKVCTQNIRNGIFQEGGSQ